MSTLICFAARIELLLLLSRSLLARQEEQHRMLIRAGMNRTFMRTSAALYTCAISVFTARLWLEFLKGSKCV